MTFVWWEEGLCMSVTLLLARNPTTTCRKLICIQSLAAVYYKFVCAVYKSQTRRETGIVNWIRRESLCCWKVENVYISKDVIWCTNSFRVFACCSNVPVQTACDYSKSWCLYIPPLPGFVCCDWRGSETVWPISTAGPNTPADTKTWSLAITKHPAAWGRKQTHSGQKEKLFHCING